MKRLFFVLAAQLSFQLLWAQQDTTLLNEAVVTASKFPTKTIQTGKVISIINAGQLAMAGGKDLSQILQEQAGIFIGGSNSNTGKDKSIYLWGASPVNTLILIDGIPVYDPAGIGGNFDIRNLSVQQIERIEIVKGSQSTLYGSDAIAGVINFITKKTGPGAFSATVLASYGSFNSWKTDLSLQGRKGKISYDAGYSLTDTKGINETVELMNAINTDRDGYRQHNWQGGIGFNSGKYFQSRAFVRYGRVSGDIDQGAYTDELDYTYNQKTWQAGLRNELNKGRWKLVLLYQYNKGSRLYIDDSVKSRNGFDTYSKGSYEGGEHMADLYANYSLKEGIRFLIGMDIRRSSTLQSYLSLPAYGPPSQLDTSSTQKSIYASVNYSNRIGFNMEMGGRLNFHTAYGEHTVYTINPSWSLGRSLKLFANYSSSYRTPSIYQLYAEYGNAKLKPEAGNSLEGGFQFSAIKEKLRGRLVVFNRKIKQGIFFYFDPLTYVSQYINQDRQKDHGLELELNHQVSKNFSLSAHYNYVTGKIYTKENGKDTSYFNLLRRPRHMALVSASWKIRDQWKLGASLNYEGKRKDAYFNMATYNTESPVLPAYLLLNIYVEYKLLHAPIQLFADGRNLTDTHYMEIAGFQAQPINLNFGARWSFTKI